MTRLGALLLLLPSCAASTETTTAPRAADSSLVAVAPAEPVRLDPRVDEALARLNDWCASSGDECQVHQQPEVDRTRVASGETGGEVSSTEEALAELGFGLAWDGSRFVLLEERDIHLVIGGNFAPDHLGPEAYEAILARLAASPDRYLDVWQARIASSWPPPRHLSSLHHPAFLRRLAEARPERVAVLATELRVVYERALAGADPEDADEAYRARLEERRDAAAQLMVR